MNRLKFLSLSLKSLKTTGTVAPSSKALCKRMIKGISDQKALNILELGAGNGVMTKAILGKISPDSRLFVSEIHPDFCRQLRAIQDSRLHIIEGSAETISTVLSDSFNLSDIDYIVSSMPFVILPEGVFDTVMKECKRLLNPGGAFIQFHYTATEKNQYLRYFSGCKVSFVPINIPPAWVYTCSLV